MFTDGNINQGLDGRTQTEFLSAHTAFSATGTNEVAGGTPAYARTSMAFDAAAARIADNTDAEQLDIPASTTVRWLGRFSAATAGTFFGMVPNGATKAEAASILDTDLWYVPAHGFIADTPVVATRIRGVVPAGLVEGTVYYVKSTGLTTDTFTVSAAPGDGAAVDVTTSGFAVVSDMVEETFGAQGTLSLAAGAFDLEGLA